MSTRLVILGLLRERPLYGYEIKSVIEDHMGDWTNITFGSIYFALSKLSDEGFTAKVATEQPGNRPSRTIYRITEEGRAEFLRLLRQVWTDVDRQFYPFDLGLSFMNALPREEVLVHLRNRVSKLEGSVRYLKAHQDEQMAQDEVPTLANAIFDHSRTHLEAELTWTRDLLARVESGEYI